MAAVRQLLPGLARRQCLDHDQLPADAVALPSMTVSRSVSVPVDRAYRPTARSAYYGRLISKLKSTPLPRWRGASNRT
jgi:hypothetical protein